MSKKKKEERKVIKRTNLPSRLPIWNTLILYMFLDLYGFSATVQAVVWTVWVMIWIIVLVNFWNEKDVDIFEND